MIGAIVIADGNQASANRISWSPFRIGMRQAWLGGVDLLGIPVCARLIEDLRRTKIFAEITLLLDSASPRLTHISDAKAHVVPDVWDAAADYLRSAKANGLNCVLVIKAGAYIEFDLGDFIQFHRANANTVTQAHDENGVLPLWVVNPGSLPANEDLHQTLSGAETLYEVQGYVNRLENLHDMRRLVTDGLNSRCKFHPHATETRPGVWIGEGAQVGRSARIVAPAFIGRDARISDQCLITRCTNIESGSQVDYGTVVEDSTVLSDTYVGIGLDLSHSVADGMRLVNLNHKVVLEISDPAMVRRLPQTSAGAESNRTFSSFRRREAAFSTTERSSS